CSSILYECCCLNDDHSNDVLRHHRGSGPTRRRWRIEGSPDLTPALSPRHAEAASGGVGLRRRHGPCRRGYAKASLGDPADRCRSICGHRHTDENQRSVPMKFRPLHDRVVVRRIDAEGKSAGGIIIPDTAQEKPQQGEVIAVGPGGRDEAGKLIPIDLKVGDRVLFGRWSGTEVKIDGQELLIMKESDIMGVLTDVPATKKKAA